ncbi:MAG: hypothetical protein E7603_03905 [Ruminococcaceae bacterium]|nr:hypothetical protein [Oscillospiraceae bacterium]
MYSRSYGSAESERKTDGISIPADYNGSLYSIRNGPKEPAKNREDPPPKQEEAEAKAVGKTEPQTQPSRQSSLGGLLEKFSAEDIILFVLVFSLLKEDSGDPGIILAVILALLLL